MECKASNAAIRFLCDFANDDLSVLHIHAHSRATCHLAFQDGLGDEVYERPTHIIVTCAASYLGDYLTGSSKTKLWIDKMELVY